MFLSVCQIKMHQTKMKVLAVKTKNPFPALSVTGLTKGYRIWDATKSCTWTNSFPAQSVTILSGRKFTYRFTIKMFMESGCINVGNVIGPSQEEFTWATMRASILETFPSNVRTALRDFPRNNTWKFTWCGTLVKLHLSAKHARRLLRLTKCWSITWWHTLERGHSAARFVTCHFGGRYT